MRALLVHMFLVFALVAFTALVSPASAQVGQTPPVSETFEFFPSTSSGPVSPSTDSTKASTELSRTSSPQADSATPSAQVFEKKEDDIVQPPKERVGEFELALQSQNPGSIWANPIKHAIRNAAAFGVSIETIVLLLLLPVVATIIAGARHLLGIRGFGIFLPAALSVVFLAMGPVVGVGLFLVIVITSTLFKTLLRRLKLKMQYLPRMALILWVVVIGVLGVLLSAPFFNRLDISEISIFPVLILILLSEDFTRVQLGKNARIAVALTTETLVLALASFLVLSLRPVQLVALLNPEFLLLGVFVVDILLGRYVGLRLLELWRFRRLIRP